VTAATYRGAYLQSPGLDKFVGGIAAWISRLPGEITWLGVALLAAGMVAALRLRQWRFAAATALCVALLSGFTGLYGAANTTAEYTLPLMVLVAVYGGLGAAALVRWTAGRLKPASTAVPLVVALCLLAAHFQAVDLHDDRQVQAFVAQTLETLPANAVVFVTSDEETFALWYYQDVEGAAPALKIVNSRLLQENWYRNSLARQYPTLTPLPASMNDWVLDPDFSNDTLASRDFFVPPPNRPLQQRDGWFILLPAQGAA
jgi:hypothetical protein